MACNGVDTRERAVLQAHLDECASCRDEATLGPDAPATDATESVPTARDRPTPLPKVHARPAATDSALVRGAVLGRYLVFDVLGRGGMGVVVNAYDPELDRRVAIKLLHSQTGIDAIEGQARLLREAQAMARLAHPNVIAVHDVGTWQDRVFVAMELVEGGTLRQWLRAQRRSWRAIVEQFVAAGRGLAAAHAAGIIHRDFKPANVLIGKDGRLRVTDFGLARADGGAITSTTPPDLEDSLPTPTSGSALLTPLTVIGAVMGTPAYMPPEQLRGADTDARSDQFSFCVALWEGLYDRRPFDGERPIDRAHPAPDEPPPEPPRVPAVPGHVRRVLQKGLSPHADGRFASMDDLLDELARDPRAAWRRVFVAGLVVAAVGSGAVASWQLSRDREQPCGGAGARLAGAWDVGRRAAVERAFLATGRSFAADAFTRAVHLIDAQAAGWTAMRVEACEATRVRGEQSEEALDLRMACLDGRLDELRGLVSAFTTVDAAGVDRAVKAAQALSPLAECADLRELSAPVRLPNNVATRARIAAIRSDLARAKGLSDAARYTDALAIVQPTIAAARAIGWRPLEAEALGDLGELLATANKPEAADTLSQALWAAEAGRHEAIAARAALRWVFLLQARGKIEAADDRIPLARALVERVGDHLAMQADLADVEGALAHRHGKLTDALKARQRALALAEQAFGSDNLRTARYHTVLGSNLQAIGELDGALAQYRTAVTIYKGSLGPYHPEVGSALEGIAAVYINAARYLEAREPAREAIEVYERTLGPTHPSTAKARLSLGNATAIPTQCRDGVEHLERGYRELLAAYGPDHPSVGDALSFLGNCDRSLRRPDQAMARFREVRRIYEQTLGPDHPWLVSPIGVIGELEMERNNPRVALPLLERAVKLGAANPESPSELAELEYYLAQALWDTGDHARAIGFARKGRDLWATLGTEPEVTSAVQRIDAWLATHR